jgi:uncharacterized protein involved in exopolysaccharide biosynthesis
MAKEQSPTHTPPPPFIWSEYWRVIVKNCKLIRFITIIIAATTLIALLVAFWLPPIYRAEVLLAPVSTDKNDGFRDMANQYGDLAALAGIKMSTSKDKTAEYIAILMSRSLSVEFIKENNLMPVLFSTKWDTKKKQWVNGTDVPTVWEAFNLWNRGIRFVNLDQRSGLVMLSIEWRDPELAAGWANRLVDRVNARLKSEAVAEAEKGIDYLEKQLNKTSSVEIQQSIYRLIEAETKKKMIANAREEYAFTVIDPAVPPERKIRPKKLMFIAMGVLVGVLISAFLICISKLLGKLLTTTDINGLPVK